MQGCVLCLVTQLCSTFCSPMEGSPPGVSVPVYSPGKNTEVGCPGPPPGDLPNPGIEPRSLTLQAYSLLSEPPAKPKNTGVGSLSLLQENFPPQELKRDLLHCRQILYQLSYKEAMNWAPFLCACWPFIYFWENVYSGPLTMFNWIIWDFLRVLIWFF